MNVLGIGLDYLMLQNNKVRGDVRERQYEYAKRLTSLSLIVYSPRRLELKSEQWADNLRVYPTNSISKATFVFDVLRISRQIFKEKNIDLITSEDPFTTGVGGYILKRVYKIPLNVQVHCNFCNNKYWKSNRLINRIFHGIGIFILRKADSIRVGTSTDKNAMISIGIDKNKIDIIPVNMDLTKFLHGSGKSIKSRLLNSRFDKLITFVGRLSKEKDIPTLLKAFRHVCDINKRVLLAIIGDGNERSFLEDICNKLELNENVTFIGSIAHNEIPHYLAASDLFVISSLFEGTCLAMAEAIASGIPIVSTKVAGAEDLILNGETGFVVAQKDDTDMADKILKILNNPKSSQEMGRKGALRIENFFSENQNIEKIIKLWETTKN